MSTPTLGRIVLALNATGAGSEAPAIITRVWGPAMINLQVLPDCAEPLCKTSVPLFPDRAAADAWLRQMVGHTPTVAYWPDRPPQPELARLAGQPVATELHPVDLAA